MKRLLLAILVATLLGLCPQLMATESAEAIPEVTGDQKVLQEDSEALQASPESVQEESFVFDSDSSELGSQPPVNLPTTFLDILNINTFGSYPSCASLNGGSCANCPSTCYIGGHPSCPGFCSCMANTCHCTL